MPVASKDNRPVGGRGVHRMPIFRNAVFQQSSTPPRSSSRNTGSGGYPERLRIPSEPVEVPPSAHALAADNLPEP